MPSREGTFNLEQRTNGANRIDTMLRTLLNQGVHEWAELTVRSA